MGLATEMGTDAEGLGEGWEEEDGQDRVVGVR